MSSEEGKSKGEVGDPHHHQHQYGTFQSDSYQPQPPAVGFPQPVPPPGIAGGPPPPSARGYYPQGYQGVPVAEGTPLRERRLPCCGIGIGWFLFIIGFFLAAIPWYVGAFILLCSRVDYREKPGFVACSIAAVIAAIAVIIGATKGADVW